MNTAHPKLRLWSPDYSSYGCLHSQQLNSIQSKQLILSCKTRSLQAITNGESTPCRPSPSRTSGAPNTPVCDWAVCAGAIPALPDSGIRRHVAGKQGPAQPGASRHLRRQRGCLCETGKSTARAAAWGTPDSASHPTAAAARRLFSCLNIK